MKKNKGDKSIAWIGDKVGYAGIHVWLKSKYGKANKCSFCISKRPSRYEWANISGKYIRDIRDWMQLCPSCHRKHDNKNWKFLNNKWLKQCRKCNLYLEEKYYKQRQQGCSITTNPICKQCNK